MKRTRTVHLFKVNFFHCQSTLGFVCESKPQDFGMVTIDPKRATCKKCKAIYKERQRKIEEYAEKRYREQFE